MTFESHTLHLDLPQCGAEARLVVPPEPCGTVLIAPAMGVRQDFYRPFAEWLASQGQAVLSFDYRGMGASRPAKLRDLKVDVLDWAREDAAAALQALRSRYPQLPLTWIGHSLGGQIAALVPGIGDVSQIVTIAAGSGYWRDNAPQLKRIVWLLWYGLVPVVTPLFGYFPGRRLGMVGDLPRGVIRQWRAWCLNPAYLLGVEDESVRAAFGALRRPVTTLSFTDDEFMSERNIDALHAFMANAPVRRLRLAPEAVNLSRIGHFGFFRSERAAALWEPYLRPLLDGGKGEL